MKGFLKVAERLSRNVLSKRLGTQKFDCEKEFLNVKIKRSRNANKTLTQRFYNVLSKRLGNKKIDCKKEFLSVKIKRSRNVNKTLTQRF